MALSSTPSQLDKNNDERAAWDKSSLALYDAEDSEGDMPVLYGSFFVGVWRVRVSFAQTGQIIEEFQSLEMFIDRLGQVPE